MVRRAIVLACLCLAASAAPAHAGALLQPGAYMARGSGLDATRCTLSFVYDGSGPLAGSTYLGTAAHCVRFVGEQIRDIDGAVWGTVALMGNASVNADDYAFIRVSEHRKPDVKPWVAGHPQYPKGVANHLETKAHDVIQLSGYGLGFDLTGPTREQRQAVLMEDDANEWRVAGPLINGDSGGPLVHVATGKALGLESGACVGALCTDEGPTIQGILAKAAARGFTVTLRPAP